MRAHDRYEALAAGDGQALEALADEILATGVDVSVTAGPESVSAPVRVGVSGSGATVVLGHIALTRCTAHVGGVRGDGIRAGHDLAGALAAAICDAECERGGPLSPRVHELCRSAQTEAARRRSERADLVAMTTMEQP
ncbi:phosphonate C-P lyase system protein PhnG [Mycolicibacterium elephantis]|uniref:phosphonate C-P lyase system protein PhnG n=1 Tax=Mycolicibacterium elephantis TaxID=81858 RepID=UPI003A86E5BB